MPIKDRTMSVDLDVSLDKEEVDDCETIEPHYDKNLCADDLILMALIAGEDS